jgi:transcriptional regulator
MMQEKRAFACPESSLPMVYLPPFNDQPDPMLIHACIREHPLGLLITHGERGLAANQIPFVLVVDADGNERLIGHVARNNDVWREGAAIGESLVVFQGNDAYISPTWYPSKAETHRTVPTWNYVTVHAYGPLVVHDDERWVRGAVGRLTKHMEATQPVPWKMADAPADYMATMLGNIVGIEVPVSRMIGKWKLGQNRTAADREGVIAGLRGTGDPGASAVAIAMADALAADTRD